MSIDSFLRVLQSQHFVFVVRHRRACTVCAPSPTRVRRFSSTPSNRNNRLINNTNNHIITNSNSRHNHNSAW
jgi:hypothetical protein